MGRKSKVVSRKFGLIGTLIRQLEPRGKARTRVRSKNIYFG